MPEEEKSFLTQLRDAGAEYLQAKLELTKVQAYEKIAKVTGIVFSMLIISLLACFTVLFAGLMLGFLISDLVHSNAIGFSVIGVVFIIMLVFLIVKRESILEKPIAEKIVAELFEKSDGDNEYEEEAGDNSSEPINEKGPS